jgi:hypothetical protein
VSLRDAMLELLKEFTWVIHILAFALVYRLLRDYFHIDFIKFFSIVLGEFRDLLKLRFNVGALNMCGFLAGLLFGVFVIVMLKTTAVLSYLSQLIGHAQGAELKSDATPTAMFFVLIFFLVFSVVFAYRDSQRKQRDGRRKPHRPKLRDGRGSRP